MAGLDQAARFTTASVSGAIRDSMRLVSVDSPGMVASLSAEMCVALTDNSRDAATPCRVALFPLDHPQSNLKAAGSNRHRQ
jgi:hypothetical protein